MSGFQSEFDFSVEIGTMYPQMRYLPGDQPTMRAYYKRYIGGQKLPSFVEHAAGHHYATVPLAPVGNLGHEHCNDLLLGCSIMRSQVVDTLKRYQSMQHLYIAFQLGAALELGVDPALMDLRTPSIQEFELGGADQYLCGWEPEDCVELEPKDVLALRQPDVYTSRWAADAVYKRGAADFASTLATSGPLTMPPLYDPRSPFNSLIKTRLAVGACFAGQVATTCSLVIVSVFVYTELMWFGLDSNAGAVFGSKSLVGVEGGECAKWYDCPGHWSVEWQCGRVVGV